MSIQSFTTKTNSVTVGLIAGTLVEGPQGWLPVENLRIGDAVQSFDGGLVRVLGLDRQWTTPKRGDYAVLLPGGALDNCSDLTVLPGQHLLLDTLNDPYFPDAMVALVPAASLVGWRGARRVPLDRPVEIVTPRFADDEAVFANSGTLLHCPGIKQIIGAATSDFFLQLDVAQAHGFLQRTCGAAVEHGATKRAA